MRSSPLLVVLALLFATAIAAFAFIILGSGTVPGLGSPNITATPQEEEIAVLVARRDLEVGTVISDTSNLFKSEVRPVSEVRRGNYILAEQASQVRQSKLVKPLSQNEPLRRSLLGPLGLAEQVPDGRRAYSIKVDVVDGVANLISEGDYVDVLVTFPLEVLYIRPGIAESVTTSGQSTTATFGGSQLVLREETTEEDTTKMVLQNIQVLRVVNRPVEKSPEELAREQQAREQQAVAAQRTPEGQQAEPTKAAKEPDAAVVRAGLEESEYIVVLSLTPQEAEVLKYSVDYLIDRDPEKRAVVSLALRGTGDHESVTTTGMTFDIIVRDWGVPVPRPLDLLRVQLEGAQETPTLETPVPTTLTPTPAP